MTTPFPRLRHAVLDATDVRALAEIYRQLLDLRYRPGDEGSGPAEWLTLVDADGPVLAFQQTEELPPSTWPSPEVPMQAHLDCTVTDTAALEEHAERALQLGARLVRDRTDDVTEPLVVLADPAGHPFCLFVG